MELVVSSDKPLILPLILEFFENNKNIDFTVGNKNKVKKLEALASYLFDWALAMNALYWLNGKTGFVIYHLSNQKISFWKNLKLNLRLIFQVLHFRLWKVLRRKNRILAQRNLQAKHQPYLYLYALGITKKVRGVMDPEYSPIIQVKHFLDHWIATKNIPVYVETVNPRNKRLYEFVGFSAYHQDHKPEEGFTTWLLKKDKVNTKNHHRAS